MNNAYTIYAIDESYTFGEPMYVNRRGLKWILEARPPDEHQHHSDAIILVIDTTGVWETEGVKIKLGHIVKEYHPIIQEIQERLARYGRVFVKYVNEETGHHAVLKLVRTSEFRYDRYWKAPPESECGYPSHPSADYGMVDLDYDLNQDDGKLNPSVHVGVFDDEESALEWLSQQEPNC